MKLFLNELEPVNDRKFTNGLVNNYNESVYNIESKYIEDSTLKEALQYLNILLESYPDHLKILMRRSYVYYKLDMFDEALAAVNRLLDGDHYNMDLLYIRSKIHYKLHHDEECIADLNRLMDDYMFGLDRDKVDDYVAIINMAFRIYSKHKMPEAVLSISNLVIENTRLHAYFDLKPLLLRRAKKHRSTGCIDEALADVNMALEVRERSGHDVPLLILRSQIYCEQGKLDEELNDLNEILMKYTPPHVESLFRRSKIYKDKGDERQAILDEYAAHSSPLFNSASVPLTSLCKMAFFKGEADIYASGIAFRDPDRVRAHLANEGINAVTLATMREKLNGREIKTKTVFDQLDAIDLERGFREDLASKTSSSTQTDENIVEAKNNLIKLKLD